MKDDKFKIVSLVKELLIHVDKNLDSFPKKEIELKQTIRKCSYDLLLIVQEGNVTSDLNRRLLLIEKGIAHIKQLDFLINLCSDKKIISNKKYCKLGESLEIILRYLVGWLNATKQGVKSMERQLV